MKQDPADPWRDFHGPNAGYVLELYQRYRQDPESVDPETRARFAQWSPPRDGFTAAEAVAPAAAAPPVEEVVGAVNLAQAIREHGHLAADLDPLRMIAPPPFPLLTLEAHGLTEADLRQLPAAVVGGPLAREAGNALEAIAQLREVYTRRIGHDYEQVRIAEEREWLRNAAECRLFRPPDDPARQAALLERLTHVEVFERFLHRIFPGKTRFSIEGLDMMVPMLDVVIEAAADVGTCNVLIGMAHRGRLNVMAHVLKKPYAHIFAEFKDPAQGHRFREDMGWTGDVKYHKGADMRDGKPVQGVITIAPNPSHLESVNPVVMGMARAAGTHVDAPGPPHFDPDLTLPILIHGDAAFPGQGIAAETLNFSRLAGYTTGGTIHIISNNQLGYTALPDDTRSTLYASDLAKGFRIPIVHVNADDPEACIEAARLAFAYRAAFHKDFLIDLIGYRRYGHNEGDEPGFTQPVMYERIAPIPRCASSGPTRWPCAASSTWTRPPRWSGSTWKRSRQSWRRCNLKRPSMSRNRSRRRPARRARSRPACPRAPAGAQRGAVAGSRRLQPEPKDPPLHGAPPREPARPRRAGGGLGSGGTARAGEHPGGRHRGCA
ncbi:MAG: thiamine pyrophosphate-dependent enzyme [Anaerolineae bacterium]|nr:thiamine pyrophosphate-dependent enzyme [Anaerolineae bacterium]